MKIELKQIKIIKLKQQIIIYKQFQNKNYLIEINKKTTKTMEEIKTDNKKYFQLIKEARRMENILEELKEKIIELEIRIKEEQYDLEGLTIMEMFIDKYINEYQTKKDIYKGIVLEIENLGNYRN